MRNSTKFGKKQSLLSSHHIGEHSYTTVNDVEHHKAPDIICKVRYRREQTNKQNAQLFRNRSTCPCWARFHSKGYRGLLRALHDSRKGATRCKNIQISRHKSQARYLIARLLPDTCITLPLATQARANQVDAVFDYPSSGNIAHCWNLRYQRTGSHVVRYLQDHITYMWVWRGHYMSVGLAWNERWNLLVSSHVLGLIFNGFTACKYTHSIALMA